MAPQVSVITIARNSSATIRDTLASVASQVDEGGESLLDGRIEHVVIDGASTDSTVAVVSEFTHVKLTSEKDRGISDAFNKGVRAASGRWLLFLNSDDYLADERVLGSFIVQVRDQSDIAYGRLCLVNRADKQVIRTVGDERAWTHLSRRMTLPHQATFFKNTYFKQFGMYSESFPIAMDYELLLRGWGKTRFQFVPLTISHMRVGGFSDVVGPRRRSVEMFRAKTKHHVGNLLSNLFYMTLFTVRPWVHQRIARIPFVGGIYYAGTQRVRRAFYSVR
jgi:glycosyltransferase involved in cell wall biosynthesis